MSWLGTALFTITAILPGTYVLAVPLVLAMLISPSVNATMFAYRIAITPDVMQGRAQSTTGMIAMALNPIGPLLGGLLIELWGGQWAFAGPAVIVAAAAGIATAGRGVRKMRPLDQGV